MNEWWNGLEPILQFFWGSALIASLLFLIQFILFLVGMGHHDTDVGGFDGHDGFSGSHEGISDSSISDAHGHDAHGSHDDSGGYSSILQYLTIRNLISFFVGLGWSGIACKGSGLADAWSVILALAFGFGFVVINMAILGLLSKLQDDGTVNIQNAVGQEATVTIRIDGEMKGTGKVEVKIQGRLMDFDAMTKGETTLHPYEKCKITGIIGGKTLIVTSLNT
ncbi:hypothetical protein JXB28_00280 [Candidatus Woesearchaeota archaeon]|nr:hypothetical protein [Candidatus Woesearchaeota archaeon]